MRGACVTIFIVTVFLLWLDSCRCLYMGLCSSVRCSISLCLQARCVYPTYWALHIFVLQVTRYTMFFEEQL